MLPHASWQITPGTTIVLSLLYRPRTGSANNNKDNDKDKDNNNNGATTTTTTDINHRGSILKMSVLWN